MADRNSLLEEGIGHLLEATLPEGAVGYHRHGQPFVEPTALAALALAPVAPPPSGGGDPRARKWLDALGSWQDRDGFFGAMPGDRDPSWATAPAALALRAHGEQQRAMGAATYLVRWKHPAEPPPEKFHREMEHLLHIDVRIAGWPWQAGELFATVEPTALACIALRTSGAAGADERIRDGVRYLEDRVCSAGGWNYGNPFLFDRDLPPITLPTAKGLLALLLCGTPSDQPVTAKSCAALARLLEENPSRKAHGWGALAFAAARDSGRAEHHARLAVDSGDGRGAWGEGPYTTALAVLALRAARGEAPECLTVGNA